MPDYLVYWKGFWDDTGGEFSALDQDWFTRNESLYDSVSAGDVLWVVVSGGPDAPEEWRLLQRLLVRQRDPNRAKSPYGPYHIIADPGRSQLFSLEQQPDFAPVLRKLAFASGKRITEEGALIGRTIQTARKLASVDYSVLEGYAAGLRAV